MQADLFNESGSIVRGYLTAFDNWKRDCAAMTEESLRVYEHMWSAYATWAVENSLALEAIDARAIEAFLLSRERADELSDRYAWRFIRLIERIGITNPKAQRGVARAVEELLGAHPEWKHANAAERAPPIDALQPEEARQLVAFLSTIRRERRHASWQEVRNCAAVGTMLGAGLTPGEVRGLVLSGVVDGGGRTARTPWKLRLADDGGTRETPIASWAGQLLRFWLDVREEQGIPGSQVFPSTKSTGKRWGKVAQYMATREVLETAGLSNLEGGSFRLRHTFALRQLRRGKRPEDVAAWLGVSDPSVMARYRRILWAPVDVD